MGQFILFSYILALIIGFITLGLTSSISFRTKDGKLFIYLIFYSAMAFDALAETIFRYLLVNNPELADSNVYLTITNSFFKFYVMFAILLMTHYFSNVRPIISSVIKYALISIIGFILHIFTINSDYKIELFNMQIIDILYYLIIFFIIGSSFIHFIKSKPTERPNLDKIEYQFLKKIVTLYTISMPLIINDDMQFLPILIRVSPFTFIILSIFTLQHFYKYHLFVGGSHSKDLENSPLFDNYEITDREKATVLLVLEGLSNKDICGRLNISLSTVKSHIYSVYKKIGIKSRFELMQIFR